MKRFSSLATCVIAAFCCANAQNVQLHYDSGHSLYKNPSSYTTVVTTVEILKPNTWSSILVFTDIDYESDSVMGACWEISRRSNLMKNKQWATHVEHDGGLGSGKAMDSHYDNRYQYTVLLGGAWNRASKDFSKTLSLQLVYKCQLKNAHTGAHPFNGFQLTEVWGTTFVKGLCTFSGLCNFWYDPNVDGKVIFLSEPQFWSNLNVPRGMKDVDFSLGTEVEISNNFVWSGRNQNNHFYATLAMTAKWTF